MRFFNRYYDGGHDDIKEIQLCLENMDSITFNRKDIGDFFIGDIKSSISRMGCNYIGSLTVASQFVLEVKKEANIVENNENYGKRNLFDRLTKYNDITAITIVYKTGKTDHYSVSYDEGENEGKLGADNINQKSRINKFGDLELVIGKDVTLDDNFYSETTNENRDLTWEMYE